MGGKNNYVGFARKNSNFFLNYSWNDFVWDCLAVLYPVFLVFITASCVISPSAIDKEESEIHGVEVR